jgi:uncharacterized protein (UPF0218 family)
MELAPAVAYRMPASLRAALGEPWGPVLATAELTKRIQASDLLVTVGDVVSAVALEVGLRPHLIVVDGHTQRGKPAPAEVAALAKWGREVRVANAAGEVTRQAWLAVREALASPSPTRIFVEGEEDLVGIPCFLEAPDGAVVLYGIPGQGVAFVRVDAAVRRRVRGVLERFESVR